MFNCLLSKKGSHLQLNDIGLLAGDTPRSRAYLQALAQNGLLPKFVLVIGGAQEEPYPDRRDVLRLRRESECHSDSDTYLRVFNFDIYQSIVVLLNDFKIPYEISSSKDINNVSVIETIRQRPESVFIYSGFSGVLLGSKILSTEKRFLHVHGGYLPDYRGSTTNYYSLIMENVFGASALFLNAEIDGGPVLLRRKFPPPVNRQAIDHIYDSTARAMVLVEVLQNYLKCGGWEFDVSANGKGETYYIIHPVLKHIAILEQYQPKKCE